MATIDEETAKALLTGPLQLQRIYRAIEAARQEGHREGEKSGYANGLKRGRGDMIGFVQADVKRVMAGAGVLVESIVHLMEEYERRASPSGVEAGEAKPRGLCCNCGADATLCYACIEKGDRDVFLKTLADVERELFEARSKHLTPPLVYWADIYMVLARLRGGDRG